MRKALNLAIFAALAAAASGNGDDGILVDDGSCELSSNSTECGIDLRQLRVSRQSRSQGSCASYGCVGYQPGNSCQCNPSCAKHKSCCSDFSKRCAFKAPPLPANKLHPREKKTEKYLQIVDSSLAARVRQSFMANDAGLMKTFGDDFGGGSCGKENCRLPDPCPFFASNRHCRFDVYDNAVAAIYLSKRGKLQDARHILDAFLVLLYPEKKIPKVTFGPEENIPSGCYVTLLGASYTEATVKAGIYWGESVADGGVDTGNNAWVAMAFAHYAAESGQSCYAAVAHDILEAIKADSGCDDGLQGFMGRLRPYPQKYRSTEHNIDMYGLGKIMQDDAVQARAGQFVRSMFGFDEQYPDAYAMGTKGNKSSCDTAKRPAPVAADAQFWNLLAGVDTVQSRAEGMLKFALKPAEQKGKGGMLARDVDLIGNKGRGAGKVLEGMRFTSWGNGAQWENTASAVMAMSLYRELHGDEVPGHNLTDRIAAMRNSILWLLDEYSSVPASVLGGNFNAWKKNNHSAAFPGGSDTGIDWTYLRYAHTAATAWAGLMLLFQGDEGHAIDDNVNPFSPPKNGVPSHSHDFSCIPMKPVLKFPYKE